MFTASQSSSQPPPNQRDGQQIPIRLILIDFKAQLELHDGLTQLAAHSIRNSINFIKTQKNHSSPISIDHQTLQSSNQIVNSQRTAKNTHSPRTTSQNHPTNVQNGIDVDHQNQNQIDLQPEIWWFVELKQDPTECSEHELKISTNDPKWIDVPNSSPTYLMQAVESIVRSSGFDRFLITIKYKRKCEAFRALGHLLGLTRAQSYSTSANPFNNRSKILTNHSIAAPTKPTFPSSNQLNQEDGEPKRSESNSHRFHRILKDLDAHHQKTGFDSLGLMIDCSRNGVLKVRRVKELIRFIALMGLNVLQLYTEDTYEIKDEPFFGYFRGPYKQDELKEIDDYAYSFGIEVVPCIQTLGHLGQMLQWPRYGGMRDTHEVLLVGSEEVYKFIEKMILSISTPLRSKKIHIGMDEAHGVSEGRYRQIFGHKDSAQVFTDHLNRVNQICTKLDLKPMIWSDMLFCLAAKNNSLGGYYDSSNPATPELVQSIPPEIELVYWDYYHTTSAPYLNKINQHRDLNRKSPAMASGVWTWSRFWTALPFTIDAIRASMVAIKNPKSGVKHALTTVWGDEGNECDIWSALPGILFYADQAYSSSIKTTKAGATRPNGTADAKEREKIEDSIDDELLTMKFDGICGGSFDDFVFASKLDDLESNHQLIDDKARFTANLSKWLMWEEPFFSILSPQYAGYDLETHYGKLADSLERAIETGRATNMLPLNERLQLPNLLAKILALKCHLRDRLVLAYRQNDREELVALAGLSPLSRLSRLRLLVDQLWRYHRDLWMSMYKPFGWEVLELRYGGLRARLETMQARLTGYMEGKLSEIEELEANTELVYPTSGAVMMLDYHRVSRPQYC